MKRFFQTIRNIFSIEDLRVRILNTIGFLIIFRLGSYVVLPGVDPDKLTTPGGIFDFLDIFLGGAFNRASIFALGIMPYISASIVIQIYHPLPRPAHAHACRSLWRYYRPHIRSADI